jgi:hypothetical protein
VRERAGTGGRRAAVPPREKAPYLREARHNEDRMRPWSTARRRVSASAHTFSMVIASGYEVSTASPNAGLTF